jgi:ADP-ribose pyrophosphatase
MPTERENMTQEIKEVKKIYRGRVIDLNVEKVTLPNDVEVELEVIRHPGGAGVVPLFEDHSIVLIRQYRHCAGGEIWEIPAGRIDEGENPLDCAVRELAEEVGYQASHIEKLTAIYSAPGFCTEKVHIFLATGLTPCETNQEEDEIIEIIRLPIKEAVEEVKSGEIDDAKTVVGILLTYWNTMKSS